MNLWNLFLSLLKPRADRQDEEPDDRYIREEVDDEWM